MTTDNTNTTRNDSLAARTDTWLQSFLVWSPGQRDIIKTVALVLMVLDHINLIFQLKQEWMFLAGRGAFPLFALVWGLNLSRHAHIRQPAINRLWGWGIIAQFAYYLAGFPWYEGNILFAFAVAAQVLTWCETRSGWRTAAAILLMALLGAFVRHQLRHCRAADAGGQLPTVPGGRQSGTSGAACMPAGRYSGT